MGTERMMKCENRAEKLVLSHGGDYSGKAPKTRARKIAHKLFRTLRLHYLNRPCQHFLPLVELIHRNTYVRT